MAQNIYDENGKIVGTIKSDQEKAADDNWSAVCTILLVAIAVVILLVLLVGGPWFALSEMEGYRGYWDLLGIAIIVVTIIAGRKMIAANQLSLWGIFWRVALIDICVGTTCSVVAQLIEWGHIDGEFIADVFISVRLSVLPAVIVTGLLWRKRRKSNIDEASEAG